MIALGIDTDDSLPTIDCHVTKLYYDHQTDESCITA